MKLFGAVIMAAVIAALMLSVLAQPALATYKARVLLDNRTRHSFIIDRVASNLEPEGKPCRVHNAPTLIAGNKQGQRLCSHRPTLPLTMTLVYRARDLPGAYVKFTVKAAGLFHKRVIDYAEASPELMLKLRKAGWFRRTPAIVIQDARGGDPVQQGGDRGSLGASANATFFWGGLGADLLTSLWFFLIGMAL